MVEKFNFKKYIAKLVSFNKRCKNSSKNIFKYIMLNFLIKLNFYLKSRFPLYFVSPVFDKVWLVFINEALILGSVWKQNEVENLLANPQINKNKYEIFFIPWCQKICWIPHLHLQQFHFHEFNDILQILFFVKFYKIILFSFTEYYKHIKVYIFQETKNFILY